MPFERCLEALPPLRLHELHVGGLLPQPPEELRARVAQPDPAGGAVAGGAGQLDDGLGGAAVLDVDRELVPAAELVVELGEAGHPQLREVVGAASCPRGSAPQALAGHGVVDEHDLAVAGEPRVGLEPGRAQLQGAPERAHGVLGRLRTGPAVGEGDGSHGASHHRAPGTIDPRTGVGTPAAPGLLTPSRSRSGSVRRSMPQIGPLEIAVVLLVALLVFGPSKLPEVGKQAARGLREFKQFQANVRDDLKGMLDPDDEPDDPDDPDDDFVPPEPPAEAPTLEGGRPRRRPPRPPRRPRSPRPTTPDPRVRRLRPTPRSSRPRGPSQTEDQGEGGCRRPHDGRRPPHRAATAPHHQWHRRRPSGRSCASSSPTASSASS